MLMTNRFAAPSLPRISSLPDYVLSVSSPRTYSRGNGGKTNIANCGIYFLHMVLINSVQQALGEI